MPELNDIHRALKAAQYDEVLRMLDEYFGESPSTEYNTLKQHIEHLKAQLTKASQSPSHNSVKNTVPTKETGKFSKFIAEETIDQIFIHQKVAELVKPYLKEWPVADDLVAACVKFRCLDDFNYFKRLEGTISKELFQQKVKARIGQYKEEVQAAEKRHADREPRSPFERYCLQHEDGSLTLEQRPTKNPLTGLTAYTRITNSVAMAFLEEVFIERSAKEKAEKLLQQAEAKAEKDFQRWVTEYLPKRLKHRTKADKTQFLRERYRQIEDDLHQLSQPLLIDLSREEIVNWVTNFFIDLSDGLNPRFSPPEHLKNILADRFKANLCLEHIDKLLSQSPETLADPLTLQPALHVEAPSNPNVLYQEGLQRQMDTLIQKLNRIRLAYAIETDAGQKFKYEQDIKALEEDIAALKDR